MSAIGFISGMGAGCSHAIGHAVHALGSAVSGAVAAVGSLFGGGSGVANASLAEAAFAGAAVGDAVGVADALAGTAPADTGTALLSGDGPMGPLGSTAGGTSAVALPAASRGRAAVACSPGGVLLERAARGPAGLGAIQGGYWDPLRGALVLVVGTDTGHREIDMESLDTGLLRTALQAAVAGDPLGVSIDPPAGYRENAERGGLDLPDGTPMLVSYLGGCASTRLGVILFEADRLLKCLTTGMDNVTRKPLTVNVRGFRPCIDIGADEDRAGCPARWHRFWFVIDDVALGVGASTDSFVFESVRLKALNEVELADGAGAADPAATAFCRHLTEHYDSYAREFPVLAQLREVAKIAAVSRWLVQTVPNALDLEALFAQPCLGMPTPDSTPGLTAVRRHERVVGSVLETRECRLFGGVNLRVPPLRVVPAAGGRADALRRECEEGSRDSAPGEPSWPVNNPARPGSVQQAVAVPLGRAKGTATRDDLDVILGAVRVRRLAGGGDAPGDLGCGWGLATPCALTVLGGSGKRDEVLTSRDRAGGQGCSHAILLLHDREAGTTTQFRESAPGRFSRVVELTQNAGGVRFSYDPTDCIRRQSDGSYVGERGGRTVVFDATGRLLECCQGSRARRYRWAGAAWCLAGFRDEAGTDWLVQRTAAGRVQALTSARSGVAFVHDPKGHLRRVNSGDGCLLAWFAYAGSRLVEKRNATGIVWKARETERSAP